MGRVWKTEIWTRMLQKLLYLNICSALLNFMFQLFNYSVIYWTFVKIKKNLMHAIKVLFKKWKDIQSAQTQK